MTPAETFTVDQLAEAVKANDGDRVRQILDAQPDLVRTDMAYENEHQVLHYAVYARLREMVRLLMQRGADARKGVWPHRAATTALIIARDRGYDEIVTIIEEEENLRNTKPQPDPNSASRRRMARPMLESGHFDDVPKSFLGRLRTGHAHSESLALVFTQKPGVYD